MSRTTARTVATLTAARPATNLTRTLLSCGILSAAVFTVVATAQVLTRDGFDLRRHPLSWHGMLHAVTPALAFLSLVIACFVYARRSAARHERDWVAYSGCGASLPSWEPRVCS